MLDHLLYGVAKLVSVALSMVRLRIPEVVRLVGDQPDQPTHAMPLYGPVAHEYNARFSGTRGLEGLAVIAALLGANVVGVYAYGHSLDGEPGTAVLLIATAGDLLRDRKYGLVQALLAYTANAVSIDLLKNSV